MHLDSSTTPVLTVAYDANGNTLTDAQGRSFTWDFENRLTQAVNPGVGTTTFRYDPFGRRIQKSGPLGATNYLYDRANAIEEIDQAGNILARYSQVPRVPDQMLAELRAGTTSYYQADGLASIISLSNSAGALANTYSYDAFGNLTGSTGTLTNPFQYTGRESDPETGIYYYRARYYSPTFGRFLSEDPIGFDGGTNLYAYVANDPADGADPWGLYATCYLNRVAGGIVCYGDDGSSASDPNAYSGYGPAANNPAWGTWEGIGPIPEGDYWIGPGYDGSRGKPQYKLTPTKDPFMHIPDMGVHDPNSYLIHAEGSHPAPRMSSEGCIITALAFRRWLAKQGGGTVTVYDPRHNLAPLEKYLSNPLSTPLP